MKNWIFHIYSEVSLVRLSLKLISGYWGQLYFPRHFQFAIETGYDVPKDLDAETFVYFDNDLVVSEKFSDSEIIS